MFVTLFGIATLSRNGQFAKLLSPMLRERIGKDNGGHGFGGIEGSLTDPLDALTKPEFKNGPTIIEGAGSDFHDPAADRQRGCPASKKRGVSNTQDAVGNSDVLQVVAVVKRSVSNVSHRRRNGDGSQGGAVVKRVLVNRWQICGKPGGDQGRAISEGGGSDFCHRVGNCHVRERGAACKSGSADPRDATGNRHSSQTRATIEREIPNGCDIPNNHVRHVATKPES